MKKVLQLTLLCGMGSSFAVGTETIYPIATGVAGAVLGAEVGYLMPPKIHDIAKNSMLPTAVVEYGAPAAAGAAFGVAVAANPIFDKCFNNAPWSPWLIRGGLVAASAGLGAVTHMTDSAIVTPAVFALLGGGAGVGLFSRFANGKQAAAICVAGAAALGAGILYRAMTGDEEGNDPKGVLQSTRRLEADPDQVDAADECDLEGTIQVGLEDQDEVLPRPLKSCRQMPQEPLSDDELEAADDQEPADLVTQDDACQDANVLN
ncbi:MAG: hypothetical protein LBJ92_00875 [Holosporales bacterium]|jgi:hypothetical protein|nr:hypothetical protein [Holosporales bacterium]